MNRLRPNVAFVLPSTDISGGVNVVLKHADILQKNGYDVTLINMVSPDHFPYSRNVSDHYSVLVKFQDDILMFFDNIVATLWSTLPDFIDSYPNKKRTTYFVQNFETGFIEYGDVRKLIANATYASLKNIHYTTMSLWCQEWLENEFHKQAQYASNGIDLEFFPYHKRDTTNRKIKIIIEGDSQDHYKNVDEAFRVVELLSPDKYEISYLSYRSKPKEWYRVDHFYNKIAPEKVGEVYAEHDILIKSSLLESFSYPPLEMMATGGVSVVVPNGGNAEYLKDGENCLLYPAGQLEVAVELIEKLTSDAEFFDEISMNGRKTAESYHWNNMEKAILGLYPVDTEKKQRFLIATDVANDLEPIVYPVNQLNQQDIYKKYYLKTALESQLPQKVSEEKQFFDILIQVDERMHQFEWTVFEQMIASINAQQYAHYRVHLNCDLEFIEKVKENLIVQKDSRFVIYEQVALSQLEIKEDSYIILYQVGDSVLPTFLSSYANKIAQEPQVVALYTDEDKLLGNETFNHFDPYFKSDMNEILLYSINYMSHTLSIRSAELQQFLVSHAIIKLTEQKKWELAFWIHERFSKNQVAHIESVQYSHRVRDVINDQTILKEEGPIDLTIAKHVSQYMPTQHQTVTCQARTFAPNTYEIKLETTDSEKVSIIIPTKNQFELLRQCVYSILTHTTHKDYEIILVDTGSKDPNVLDFYEAIQTDDSRVRVVEFVQKTFNFSAACNKGAACATGEHFVFLNNDTAILDASWLEKLLVYSVRKDTGCIGTKLVYPGNRMIQHAGIATGVNGVATNLFNGLYIDQIQSRSQHYYYNFTREVTAVTAACLMIKRTIFEAVSGFDVAFAVTFNDVDFCLRVQELELKNVYVADSLLEHRESVSVGKLHEEHREQAEFLTSETLFKSRWSNFVVHDPYFNRNFSTQTSMMELPNSY